VTPDQVGELLNVSRETINKFQVYLTLLEKWQRRINLVSNSTLADAWQRHILDSVRGSVIFSIRGNWLPITHPRHVKFLMLAAVLAFQGLFWPL